MKINKISGLVFMFFLFPLGAYCQIWNQYTDSAKVYQNQNNPEKAIEFYNKAKEVLQKDSAGTSSYATSCNSLAVLYEKTLQYGKAEPLFILARQIRGKVLGKNHPDYASSCNNLGIHYEHKGHYLASEQLYRESRQIFGNLPEKEKTKYMFKYVFACINLAKLYEKMGQYDNAEPLFLEAKQIQQKVPGNESQDYASSCYMLAGLYKAMGQYDKAEPLFMEAKQILEKAAKDDPKYASVCIGLADLYEVMGQYEKAEPIYLDAKQILENTVGKDDPDYATCCDNIATLYWAQRLYKKAEPLYLESEQIRKKVLENAPNNFAYGDYAFSCNNLGNLYTATGKYRKAELLYLEAREILSKKIGRENPDYATFCFNLADLYGEIGNLKKAKPLFLEALQIQEKMLGKQHPDYGSSCVNVANLYRVMNQPLLAENYFTKSFSVDINNLSSFFQFANEKEKMDYIKNNLGENNLAYSFYASTRLKSGQPYSLALFHRNLILSSLQATRKELLSSKDTSLIDKYNEWLNFKKYLAFLYSKPIEERNENVSKIEEKAGQLEKDLSRLSYSFKKQEQKVDWKDIRNSLRSDEASIEFVNFYYNTGKRWTDSIYYVALILRKDKPDPEFVKLFEERQLNALLNRKNLSSDSVYINRLYAGNGTLYNLIWKPMAKYLNGVKKIYFAPAGNLFKISFAALRVNSKQVLGDKYQIIQLNTTASVTENNESFITTQDKIQLYGGINYDADSVSLKRAESPYPEMIANSRSLPLDHIRGTEFEYLPASLQEVEKIKIEAEGAHIPVTILSGTYATEESVKALTGNASPSVLHIATHGFFFPDPKTEKLDVFQQQFETARAFRQSDNPLFRSGLLMAGAENAWKGKSFSGIEDGILTAYEVSNLYLPNTKLVVLSACETALGDIQASEGVYGLQRAFRMAGAQNLVMSLWEVPDVETAQFMQLFYKNLFASQSIQKAFYSAQKVMKNKYPDEPYKWAAWVLVR